MKYLIDADWLIDAATGRARAQQMLSRLRDNGHAVSIVAAATLEGNLILLARNARHSARILDKQGTR